MIPIRHPWLLAGGAALVLWWLHRRSQPVIIVGPGSGPATLGAGAPGSGASSPLAAPGQGAQASGQVPPATLSQQGGVTTIGPVTPSNAGGT